MAGHRVEDTQGDGVQGALVGGSVPSSGLGQPQAESAPTEPVTVHPVSAPGLQG